MIPYYELRPTDISVIHNRRELKYRSHMHSEVEMIYVFEQGQHMSIGDKKYEIKAGQAAVIFPDTEHTYHRPVWRDTRAVFVICSQKIFRGTLPDLRSCMPEDPLITDVGPAVSMAFSEIAECSDYTEQAAWALIIMLRLYKKLRLIPSAADPVAELPRRLMDYIGAHFTEDITVERLCREFSVSRYYISRAFGQRIKMSLPKYLGRLRSDFAAELLRTTDLSITEISARAGFASQSTFNRAFRETHGATPSELRHASRN